MTLPAEIAATGFALPDDYLHAWSQGLCKLPPWRFLEGEAFLQAYARVNRSGQRLLLPFAERSDLGEVACFEVLPGPAQAVEVLHTDAEGRDQRVAEFASFWDFFRQAVEDMIKAAPAGEEPQEPQVTWEFFRRRAGAPLRVSSPA